MSIDEQPDTLAGALPTLNVREDEEWVERAACAGMSTELFFVQAGRVIDEGVLETCRGCPVRLECLRHAYREDLGITAGYFGGVSPGQRRGWTLAEAEEFIASDPPRSDIRYT